MRAWCAAVLLLGACGRIGFDGAPDGVPDAAAVCVAPIGHDEDADGVDDACDVCPETGASQADVDGDGVGDDCDPDPTISHTRTLFDAFTGPRPAWQLDPRQQLPGDVLRTPAADVGAIVARLTGVPGRAVFATAGRVTALGALGVADHQISIAFGPSGAGSYYCELYNGGAGLLFQFTYTLDDVNFFQLDSVALPGSLLGEFALTVTHTPPTMSCTARWLGQTYTLGGAIPGGLPADIATYVVTGNLDDEFDYFVRLALP